MRQTETRWQYSHVRGHQDNKKNTKDLNRLEKLNGEMDTLAKLALTTAPQLPLEFDIEGAPWSHHGPSG
jgi:hypothetical protein